MVVDEQEFAIPNDCQMLSDLNNNNQCDGSKICTHNDCYVANDSPIFNQIDHSINTNANTQPNTAKVYLMSNSCGGFANSAMLKSAQRTKVKLAKRGKNNGTASTIVSHDTNNNSSSTGSNHNLQTDV